MGTIGTLLPAGRLDITCETFCIVETILMETEQKKAQRQEISAFFKALT